MAALVELERSEIHVEYMIQVLERQVRTIITADARIVDDWINRTYLLHRCPPHQLLVGLHLQFEEEQVGGVFLNRICVLQISVWRRCLLLHHAYFLPDCLRTFLHSHTVVGVHMARMMELLHTAFNLELQHTIDLGQLAAIHYELGLLRFFPVRYLFAAIIEDGAIRQLPQVIWTSWNVQQLYSDHIISATVDSYAVFQIALYLIPHPPIHF